MIQAATARDTFSPEQIAWLEERFNAIRTTVDRVFDRTTLMWIIGGLTALGVAAAGLLYAEIGKSRVAIVELAKGQARIKAILNERLPRLAEYVVTSFFQNAIIGSDKLHVTGVDFAAVVIVCLFTSTLMRLLSTQDRPGRGSHTHDASIPVG